MRYAVIENGVVVNVAKAEADFAASQGWVASDTAQIGWLYDGETFSEPPPAPGTVAGVIAERERRLALGFDYDFGDERGEHHVGTSPRDMEGWDEVTKGSSAAILIGNPNKPFMILTETGPVQITALEWQQILGVASDVRQSIWTASFVLQNMSPIPQNFADDAYWST